MNDRQFRADGEMNEDDFSRDTRTFAADVQDVSASGESPLDDSSTFEDLTLAQVFSLFWRDPAATWRMVSEVARASNDNAPYTSVPLRKPLKDLASVTPHIDAQSEVNLLTLPRVPAYPEARRLEAIQLMLRIGAVSAAIWGGWQIATAPAQGLEDTLTVAARFWLLGFLVWLLSEFIGFARPLRLQRERTAHPVQLRAPEQITWALEDVMVRAILGVTTIILTILAVLWTSGNFVTLQGFIAWVGSMTLAVWTFSPYRWSPLTAISGAVKAIRHPRLRVSWTMIGFVAILVMGAFFRFSDIDGTPPEPTSDHAEKLIDAQKVLDGETRLFYPNNGGREAMQMYLMALLAKVPGFGINFDTLKTLSAIEGFLTIPVVYALGRALVGAEDRRLGAAVGLAAAALIAASYWHQTLSHLGLRIVLTTFFTSLVLLFLVRGIRSNHRWDFIWAGLMLGIGLYAYQAVRMLPVVVVAGLWIALLYKLFRRGDHRLLETRRLVANSAVLVIVALVAFAPLLNFIRESPRDFLERTNTRLLGDGILVVTDSEGNTVTRTANMLELIWAQRDVFLSNLRNAVLSYNFSGDIAWLQSAPLYPFMDMVTGAFLICGLAAWLGLMVRRRDPAFDLWLPMIFILILPSALAVAFPIENPSATRLSGSMPGVYLLAAFALAVFVRQIWRVLGRRLGFVVGIVTALALIFAALTANYTTYFGPYRQAYLRGALPYTNAATVLRSFVEGGGGYGNAFVVTFPHWWDHRAVGIEAGAPGWQGDIIPIGFDPEAPDYIPARDRIAESINIAYQRSGQFQFDPERDILFFYEATDQETQNRLIAMFPQGYWNQVIPEEFPNKPYRVFRVPALEYDGFAQFQCDYLNLCLGETSG